MSLPAGSVRGTFALAHAVHDVTYLCTSNFIFGLQYLPRSNSSVRPMPGWPVAGLVWAHVMSFPRKCDGTKTLLLGRDSGGRDAAFSVISLSMSHLMELTQHVVASGSQSPTL